jgi:hypothetical protein
MDAVVGGLSVPRDPAGVVTIFEGAENTVRCVVDEKAFRGLKPEGVAGRAVHARVGLAAAQLGRDGVGAEEPVQPNSSYVFRAPGPTSETMARARPHCLSVVSAGRTSEKTSKI